MTTYRGITIISMATAAALALALTTGCTTFGHKGNADADNLGDAAGSQSTVVIQVGQQDPVVAHHDRQYYLEQRQAKDVMPRLRGAIATGEADAAVQLAKARLAKAPGDPEALTMLASALVLTKNYDLAAYYAGLLERAQPGNPVALNIKGLATMMSSHARLADFKLAMTYFQQALAADATQIAPGLNLGNLQLEMGNAPAAAATFGQVVDRCGRCSAGLMGFGIAASRSRQFPQAEAAFAEVLKKNPNHAAALYNLALVYKNGYNNSKEAEKYLFALINSSHTKNVALKERAQVVLRMIKGEASQDERTQIADDEEPSHGGKGAAGKAGQADDPSDAELLMTGAHGDDAEE